MDRRQKIETGPIRPPSEAGSLLIRVTRNCPWNRCLFCPVYKGEKFSAREPEEVKEEIDLLADAVRSVEKGGEKVSFPLGSAYPGEMRRAALWAMQGSGSVFLQDADSPVIGAKGLSDILRHLKEKLPGVKRITSYATSRTIARLGADAMKRLKDSGLDRLHLGLESGADSVLDLMKKGVDKERQVLAGRYIREANMELSLYYMPGLGGRELSREHATHSADAVNKIAPHYIRLRTLRVHPKAPLKELVEDGRFVQLTDDETVKEIRLFIENLDGIDSILVSDHIVNVLGEVAGRLPGDKEKMLAVIDRYLALDEETRLIFRVGRIGGAYHSLDGLKDEGLKKQIADAIAKMRREGMDVEEMVRQTAEGIV